MCILSFWATFWSATEEGNASNAQNLVLQCKFKGFWAPPSPLEGVEFMLSEHFNTLFLRKSVYSVILGNFLERYGGRKCVQRSKPCFTMQIQRFLGSADHARKCENDDFGAFEHTFLKKKCVEMHFLEFWTEPA